MSGISAYATFSDMTETEMFTLRIPSAIIKQVDEYWHAEGLRSRTAAMLRLMADGLRAQLLLEKHDQEEIAKARAARPDEARDSATYLAALIINSPNPPTRSDMLMFRHLPRNDWEDLMSEFGAVFGSRHMEAITEPRE